MPDPELSTQETSDIAPNTDLEHNNPDNTQKINAAVNPDVRPNLEEATTTTTANPSKLSPEQNATASNPFLSEDGKIIAVNPKTGERTFIDPGSADITTAINQARSDGWSLPADQSNNIDVNQSGQLVAIHPKTGAVTHIDMGGADYEDAAEQAKKDGWLLPSDVNKYQVDKGVLDKYTKLHLDELHKNGMFGFGSGALDAFATGVVSNIATPTLSGSDVEQEAEKSANETYLGEHGLSKTVGQIAGPAALLGTAGSAISKAVGATGVLAAAIENATFAAPDAMKEALEGNFKQAAESLAIGGLVGVGLHGVGWLGGKAIGKITGKATKEISEEDLKELSKLELAKDDAQKEWEETQNGSYIDNINVDALQEKFNAQKKLIEATKALQDHPEHNDIYQKSATNAAEVDAARKSLDEAQEVLQKHPEYNDIYQKSATNAAEVDAAIKALDESKKALQAHPEYNDIYQKSATNAAEVDAAIKALNESQKDLQAHPEYSDTSKISVPAEASKEYKELFNAHQEAQQNFIKATKENATVPTEASDEYHDLFNDYQKRQQNYIKATKGNATVPTEASDEYKELFEAHQEAQQDFLSLNNDETYDFKATEYNPKDIAKEALDAATAELEAHPLYKENMETRRKAANTLGEHLGMSPQEVSNLNQSLQDLPKLVGLNEKDKLGDIVKKITEARESSGNKIGSIMKKLDSFKDEFYEDVEGIQHTPHTDILGALTQSVRDIDSIMNSAVGVEKDQIAKTLTPLREQIVSSIARSEGISEAMIKDLLHAIDPETKQLLSIDEISGQKIRKYADPNKAYPLTFSDTTQHIKKWWGDQVNWNGADNNFVNNTRLSADAILRRNFGVAEDAAIKGLGPEKLGAETISEIRRNRSIYGVSKAMKDISDRLGAKEVLKTPLSAVLDHFQKLTGHLSAYSLPGVALHAFGGTLAMAAGGGIFGVAKLIDYINKEALLGKSINILNKSTRLGTDLAAETMKSVTDNMNSKISDFFDWKKASSTIAKASSVKGAINVFLPNNGVGLSDRQKVEALREQTTKLLTDPQYAANHWENNPVTKQLNEEGLKNVSQAYQEHIMRLAKVIQLFLPPNAHEVAATPFSANVVEKDVDPAAMARLNNVLKIADDPTHLLDLVKSNSITAADTAIAAAINPNFINKMKMAMLDEQTKSKSQKQDLSFQHRMSLGILMGMNIDAATEPKNIAAYQAAYVPFSNPLGANTSGKGSKGGSPHNLDEVSNSFKTGSQNAATGSD